MISLSSSRLFEKFVFSKQTNRSVRLGSQLPELRKMGIPYPLRGKIFYQSGVKEFVGRLSYEFTVDVFCLDLNIDRKFDNCFHNLLMFYKIPSAFVRLGLIRAVTDNRAIPSACTWEKEFLIFELTC